MSNIIEQKAGNLDAVIIDRGASWKTNATFDFDISSYTIDAYIKFGSNKVDLVQTPITDYIVKLELTKENSSIITTEECTLYVWLTYLSESRPYIKTLFKVIQ